MEVHKSKRFNKRHDDTASSWRIFYKEKILRKNPGLDSDVVDAYDNYGYLVGPDKSRLTRPANDYARLTKEEYESRVLLFGSRLGSEDGKFSESDLVACKDFIDESSQYFGDEFTFLSASRIVFLPPAMGHELVASSPKARIEWRGAVTNSAPGVIFINSRQSLDYESLIQTLRHELAHVIHGDDITDASDLLKAVGWQVGYLDDIYPGWQHEPRLIHDRYFEGSDKLSSIAKHSLRETIAETYTEFMESKTDYSFDEVARDSLIDYLSKRVGRPLATPINWQSARDRSL